MMSYGQRIITKPREINTETPTVIAKKKEGVNSRIRLY